MVNFRPVYPSKDGKGMPIPTDPDDNEDNYLCQWCGCPCDGNVDALGPGEGISYSGTAPVIIPSVDSGCPGCGSLNWRK